MVRKTLFHIFLFAALSFVHEQVWSQSLDTIQFNSEARIQRAKPGPAADLPTLGPIRDFAVIPSRRKWIVGTGTALAYSGSFVFLNQAWYKDYPRSSFHAFNDGGEWMQMDKIGHAWTAYNTGKANTALWRWAGVNNRNAVLLGSGSSLLYMLSIEYLDGRSAEWGWSWTDVAADISGSLLFASQQLAWKDEKILLKFSAHNNNYETSLNDRADDLFGNSIPERLLKDYNAQTYWLSLNINSVFNKTRFPKWLNIAVGYGADGMFGGYENLAFDKNGNVTFDRRDIKRYRQWYLAPDVDFTKIKTNSRVLHTLFFAMNALKFPAPALEFSNNKIKFRPLAF